LIDLSTDSITNYSDMYMFNIELISSMRISEETKKAIIKIGAEVTAKDGKERSMEDVVTYGSKCYSYCRSNSSVCSNSFCDSS
jgi:hypothetical protein